MQDNQQPPAPQKTQFYRNKVFLIGISFAAALVAGTAVDLTFNQGQVTRGITQLFVSNSLAELDSKEHVTKVLLVPIMTTDEIVDHLPNNTASNQKSVEKWQNEKCLPEKISRYDRRFATSPRSKPIYELPAELSTRPSYEKAPDSCKPYAVLAFTRRPFLFSATVNNGDGLVQWARKNQKAGTLWEADLMKYFLADWTGFASLSQDALGLDKVAGALLENFLSHLFQASPRFHLQHELGRRGWVISLKKDQSKKVLQSLLLFARQSLQSIYQLPEGGKIYEWMVLNNKVFVTQTDGELLIATGLGSLISYMSVPPKLWDAPQTGDTVLTLRLDSLVDSLVPLVQIKPQAGLSQFAASFSISANEQGLRLDKGMVSPSKLGGLLNESFATELYDAIPQEFALSVGLAWEMPSLQWLNEQGPEAFLKKSSNSESGLLFIWDIDPKNNSHVALVGMGSAEHPSQAWADHTDQRSCESRSHKRTWIQASHPDLGARIQASCRQQANSPYGKLFASQSFEQKPPQAMLSLNLGEMLKSLYMLGGGHPDAAEAEPKSAKDAGRLAAKAEAMQQVKDLSSQLPVVGYAGRAQADGSILWQGF